MKAIGEYKWVIPGGRIPFPSNGKEPELLSQDKVSVLNTNEHDITLTMTIFNTDKESTGPYRLKVQARRVRKFRVNDLIDPYPVNLETDYALLIEADSPIVVQFTRMNTGYDKAALMGGIGFASHY